MKRGGGSQEGERKTTGPRRVDPRFLGSDEAIRHSGWRKNSRGDARCGARVRRTRRLDDAKGAARGWKEPCEDLEEEGESSMDPKKRRSADGPGNRSLPDTNQGR